MNSPQSRIRWFLSLGSLRNRRNLFAARLVLTSATHAGEQDEICHHRRHRGSGRHARRWLIRSRVNRRKADYHQAQADAAKAQIQKEDAQAQADAAQADAASAQVQANAAQADASTLKDAGRCHAGAGQQCAGAGQYFAGPGRQMPRRAPTRPPPIVMRLWTAPMRPATPRSQQLRLMERSPLSAGFFLIPLYPVRR